MAKKPKTVGEMIDILSRYNQDHPLRIELIKHNGKDFKHGLIADVYKGENFTTNGDTVFIRFED